MANTYQSIDLDAVGGSTQPSLPISFQSSDWVLAGTVYSLEILASAHQRGASPQVQVFEKVGTDFVEVIVDIKVESNGNIIVEIEQSPDLRFEGKIVISGE